MSVWNQYSILGDWSRQRIDSLPHYATRWHFLFEPQLLVRVEMPFIDKPDDAVWGDVSKIETGAAGGGLIWPGDKDFYLTEDLCEANLDFLHANSNLVRVLRFRRLNGYRMQRKHVHLLCNQFGMDYWQEFCFLAKASLNALRLFWKFGRR